MNRIVHVILVALLLGLAPRSAPADVPADPDVIVQVRVKKIREIIRERITAQLSGSTTRFVSIDTDPSPAGPDVMAVTLNLMRRATVQGFVLDIPVEVKFEILLGCNASGPFLQPRNADVIVHALGVPAATVQQIEDDANAVLDAQRTPIVNGLWKMLGTVKKAFVNIAPVCPRYQVTDNGGLRAELFFETGCINGRTRTESCSPTQVGSGYHYRCGNGEWNLSNADCRLHTPTPDPFPDRPPPEGGNPH